MNVVLSGVQDLGDELVKRLPGLEIHHLDPGDSDTARDRLPRAAAAVLSLAAHDRFRDEAVPLDLPRVVFLDPSTPTGVLRRLTEDGVQRIMFEPVDPAEVAREVRRVTGLMTPAGQADTAGDEAVTDEIAALWDEFSGTMVARLELLEETGTSLFEGDRDPSALDAARTAAHKLHGSLGTFGLDRASEIAAEVEAILDAGAATDGDVFHYAGLLVTLRSELERAMDARPAAGMRDAARAAEADTVGILILEPDPTRAEGAVTAALAVGWSPRVAGSLDTLIEEVERQRPDLLVLNPAPADGDRLRTYLRRLTLYPPRPPVVYWSDDADLATRVRAAGLGVGAFVEHDRDPHVLIARATELLREETRPVATILVVDDDPALLALVGRALNDDAFRVTAISDPLLFWDALEATCPDLVLLDIDMPHISGIQLCRVVRASTRWAHLPITFLTGQSDGETLTRAFRAGADDCIIKPLPGRELRARVESRLDRMRLHRRGPGTSLATGTLARATAADRTDMAIALARRHGEPLAVAVVRVRPGEDDNVRMSLSRVAGAIREDARPEDVIARWSATELLVCLYGMTAPEAAAWVESRIPTDTDGTMAHVRTAAFPADGSELNVLIQRASSPQARTPAQDGVGAANAPDSDAASVPTADAAASTERVDVVLVEDDEALAALLLQTLAARDFTTRWIADGVEAVRVLAGDRPSVHGRVILLDIGLPGLDGLTVLRRLARSAVTARSRVVMLTARSAEAEVLRSLELGAFDYVPKPFSVAELLHRVRRAMETGDRRA